MTMSTMTEHTDHELFPGHTSTLTVTDPELTKFLNNFISGEVIKATELESKTRLMPYNGYPRTLNAIRCINEVIPE